MNTLLNNKKVANQTNYKLSCISYADYVGIKQVAIVYLACSFSQVGFTCYM